jgi:hypothetical protein
MRQSWSVSRHDASAGRLGFDEHLVRVAAVRQVDPYLVAVLTHDQLDRIGDQLDLALGVRGVEHPRMPDQGQRRPYRMKVVFGAIILVGGYDRAQGGLVLGGQIVELGVALAQALQRHRPAGVPAAALRRLLDRGDLPTLSADAEDQPARLGGGFDLGLGRRGQHALQLVQRPLPRRPDRHDLQEGARIPRSRGAQEALPALGRLGEARVRLRQNPNGQRRAPSPLFDRPAIARLAQGRESPVDDAKRQGADRRGQRTLVNVIEGLVTEAVLGDEPLQPCLGQIVASLNQVQ